MVYDEPLGLGALRNDLVFYPVPFDKLVQPVTTDAKLKKLLRNMAYVGVVARPPRPGHGRGRGAIGKQFRKKAKANELNVAAARAGFDHAQEKLQKKDPFAVERMDATRARSSSTATRPRPWARSSAA